jgi:hypothetical protein
MIITPVQRRLPACATDEDWQLLRADGELARAAHAPAAPPDAVMPHSCLAVDAVFLRALVVDDRRS